MFHRKTYTCCKKKEEDSRSPFEEPFFNDRFEMENLKEDAYEPPAPELVRMEASGNFLRIAGLKKTYANGFKAVKGLNIKMYNN